MFDDHTHQDLVSIRNPHDFALERVALPADSGPAQLAMLKLFDWDVQVEESPRPRVKKGA